MSKRNILLNKIEQIANPDSNKAHINLSIRGKRGKRTPYKSVPFKSRDGEDLKIEADSQETADVFLRLRGLGTSS